MANIILVELHLKS